LTEIPRVASRFSSRFSSSSTSSVNEVGTPASIVPEFRGYKGIHEFEGVNKTVVRQNNCDSVLSFFQLYITIAIMQAFVNATNFWGRTFHQKYWKKKIDIAEFKAFLAIVFEMGVIKYPNREISFENSDHGSSFIRNLMTKSRFDMIMMCWRYEDYSKTSATERQNFKLTSPFWAAKAFIVLVATAFDNLFNPGQMLDIDEQCIPWKGRHRCRCYNPNKPEKWHFKVFALNPNDAATGYMCSFYLYEGKAEARDADISATTQPVKKLFCDNAKFYNRNHIMITDNWYTQQDNHDMIVATRNHCPGTINSNKRGMPAEGKFPKTGRLKKNRGEYKQMEKLNPNGKKSYFTAWQDNKPVHLLSSFPSYISTCKRVVRNADGSWDLVDPFRSLL